MILLGLTGSIGMGKSTTAAMFVAEGIPLHDADQAVHQIYDGRNERAAALVEAEFPGTVKNGKVDRELLGKRVFGDPVALKKLEAIIHPLVREAELSFVKMASAAGSDMAVLDIPLLFETGGDARMDGIIVVSADEMEQRRRVLQRPGMSEEKFASILARQLPDVEKRRRADFVIDTSKSLEAVHQRVREIIVTIRADSGALHWKKPRPV